MADCVLVTGSSGFLGAWIVKDLIERGLNFVLLDRDADLRRLGEVMPNHPPDLTTVTAEITDLAAITACMRQHEITSVIHLAGLQIPACRSDPMKGAEVNVAGTLAVFEAARQAGTVKQIAYASSAAVIGPEESYPPGPIPNDAPLYPATHYGVFKQCNEGNAKIYFQDHGMSSIGLRPWTVYGAGRDQGVTSDATRAIKSAVVDRPFTIRYAGRNALQFAGDVAAAFVLAALDRRNVAATFNLRGDVVEMTKFISLVEELQPSAKGRIQLSGGPIPVACDLDDSELRRFFPNLPQTPLREGILRTLEAFEAQRAAGRLSTHDLDE
ncbi:MAG: NAD(P)-dependent oxidoreductase [Acidobacteria bacterium]|nr:NAD(P)-dependent oxidoreductase [Acidobacteriota bacterium]